MPTLDRVVNTIECIFFILWSFNSYNNWILETIINESDIIFEDGMKIKSFDTYYCSISHFKQLFKQSSNIMNVHYVIGSKPIVLKGHFDGKEINLFLDGQARHSIDWKRKKAVGNNIFPTNCMVINDGAYCARVVMKNFDGVLLANPITYAYEENVSLILKIIGQGGFYVVVINPS